MNNKCIPRVVYKNSTREYPAFIKNMFAKFIKFRWCDPNIPLPAQAKLYYFPLLSSMPCFVSQPLYTYLHCNAMIFVYKVFPFCIKPLSCSAWYTYRYRMHFMWLQVFFFHNISMIMVSRSSELGTTTVSINSVYTWVTEWVTHLHIEVPL